MKNTRRLFIAINFPEEIKKRISRIVAELSRDAQKYSRPSIQVPPLITEAATHNLSEQDEVKFLSPENWHLTISFLGWQPDEAIDKIIDSIKETCGDFTPPEVGFKNVFLAPPKKPRMIWLSGTEATNSYLDEIKNRLDDLLVDSGVRFKVENRKYNAHVTLARFSGNMVTVEFDEYLLKFNEKFNLPSGGLNFEAESLDLMESNIGHTGAEHIVLSKIAFNKESLY